MKLLLSNPRGFCAGVDRAIDIVEKAIEIHGKPIYVKHEVVHNKLVVDNLKEKGAIFIEDLNEVPKGNIVIFSAHGVSKKVRKQANDLDLQAIDATCPLVTKVHLEAAKLHRNEQEIIMIGHHGHPEVEGTMGQVEDGMYLVETIDDIKDLKVKDKNNVSYVTQTTLSLDDTSELVKELQREFPKIEGPKKQDICYATQNRQDAVKKMAENCDLFLVVGSENSSNTNRLREVAAGFGVPSYRIDNAKEFDKKWLEGVNTIGLSAGASAPEILVQEVVDRLKNLGVTEVEEVTGVEENVFFPRPKELNV